MRAFMNAPVCVCVRYINVCKRVCHGHIRVDVWMSVSVCVYIVLPAVSILLYMDYALNIHNSELTSACVTNYIANLLNNPLLN